jgi:pimeloyl-ACP methyl ester carboxylesterase
MKIPSGLRHMALGIAAASGVLGHAAQQSITASKPCAGLVAMQIENTTLTEAVDVPAGQPIPMGGGFGPPVMLRSLPAHCLVHGEVNRHRGADGKEYGDKFEIRMPVDWSGRLLFQGGGGLDGILNPALGLSSNTPNSASKSALNLGYAVVSTDGGHQDSSQTRADGSFGSDPGARDDYDFLSTKRVTDVARKVIAQFYGQSVQHSYFRGCSNGGREGLIAVERYPEYFDGVIAGSPAFNLTHAAIAEAWNTVQLASIAPKGPNGMPDLSHALSNDDMKLLADRVVQQCDSLDGLKDGMIFNPEACHFDPRVLQCSGEKDASCLTAAQVETIKKVFGGPHDSHGKAIYSNWPYDAGDGAPGWRVWMMGMGPMHALNETIFPSFFNGLALAGAQPPIDIFKFNFDTDPARIEKASSEINATSVDWSGLRKRGGKVLLYVGMSDPVFSPFDLIRYYKQIEEHNGGEAKTQEFARLFLVPGMNHCGGGPALDDFDTLTTMQKWVEDGTAPQSIISSGQAFPGRTRPLCAYPLTAIYDGKGNPEDATSFSCQKPKE